MLNKLRFIMFRAKDFMLMDVVDIRGRKIGFIKDIVIDFHNGVVIGFMVSSYKLFQNTVCVLKEDIVSFNKSMIVNKLTKKQYLGFDNIKNMDIINSHGDIIGMAEDILFKEFTFKIHGVIVSTGFIKNLITGKKILLINNLILGEANILYYINKDNIDFISVPHKLFAGEKHNEKII
jgi:uncharacterized protein YrrD